MGCYVNPGTFPAPPGAKERWLQEHATEVYNDIAPKWHDPSDGMMLVCWNRAFTSAIVCYKEDEYDEVVTDTRSRNTAWFLCSVEDLKKVSPLEQYLALEARDAANV